MTYLPVLVVLLLHLLNVLKLEMSKLCFLESLTFSPRGLLGQGLS